MIAVYHFALNSQLSLKKFGKWLEAGASLVGGKLGLQRTLRLQCSPSCKLNKEARKHSDSNDQKSKLSITSNQTSEWKEVSLFGNSHWSKGSYVREEVKISLTFRRMMKHRFSKALCYPSTSLWNNIPIECQWLHSIPQSTSPVQSP